MSTNRFAIPLADLDDAVRVPVTQQVEMHAEPRRHAPMIAATLLPLAGGCGAFDGDGD